MRRLIFLLTLTLVGCQCQKPKLIRIEEIVMQMPLCVQVKGPLSYEKQDIIDTTIATTFQEIDRIYNCFNPDSEVSIINKSPAWTPILLSEELASFLHQLEQFVSKTEGRFDPTVAPIQKLWLTHLKEGVLPSQEALHPPTLALGWSNLSLTHRILYKKNADTQIDLSGIAKGLAVDLLADRLASLGFTDCYVEWGGEITTRGEHPLGRPWQIGLHSGEVISPHNLSIATSGTYLQYWTVNETTYSHVYDIKHHTPLTVTPGAITSVTVVTDSCMLADMLATTLMLFDTQEEARAWADEHFPSAQIWITTSTDL